MDRQRLLQELGRIPVVTSASGAVDTNEIRRLNQQAQCEGSDRVHMGLGLNGR
jgi:hypothetical protein